MLTQHTFVKAILEGDQSVAELSRLLGDVNEDYIRRLSTMMFIMENCKANGRNDVAIFEYINNNFSKVLSIVEQHNLVLPEEVIVIERVVKQLAEEGAPGIMGGTAAGTINTAAAVATSQIDTDAVDATTPRIYPGKKKKKDSNNVILS